MCIRDRGLRWVIDPIDGTTNFVYGHPGYSVSVAAEVAMPSDASGPATTMVGVVADIVAGDLFWAQAGGGAFRNGDAISATTIDVMNRALVATGFNYLPEVRSDQARVLGEILPAVADIRRMGGCAVDLCSVAMGRVDAYFERGVQPWDHAAGGLIATEAGAVVANLRGGGPDSTMCLAAGPALFEQLSSRLRALNADPSSD